MTKETRTAEFAAEKQKTKSLEKVIFGNGQNGLVKKIGTIEDEIIVIKSYNHIKTWILGGAVTILSSMVGSMAIYIWITRFGG